jgi:hypothetical protein
VGVSAHRRECHKLGVRVSATSVRTILRCHGLGPARRSELDAVYLVLPMANVDPVKVVAWHGDQTHRPTVAAAVTARPPCDRP